MQNFFLSIQALNLNLSKPAKKEAAFYLSTEVYKDFAGVNSDFASVTYHTHCNLCKRQPSIASSGAHGHI